MKGEGFMSCTLTSRQGVCVCVLPVESQIDAADAQVVSGPNEAGLQVQRSAVRLHRLLAAVAIRQRRSQTVPQQVVL